MTWAQGSGNMVVVVGRVVVEEEEEEVEQAATWFSFLLIPGPAMPRCVPTLGGHRLCVQFSFTRALLNQEKGQYDF